MSEGQVRRLPSGGHIDRDRLVSVRFDGRLYQGYAGDTLASLLLANGVQLIGRSFKYHRPRGILAAGHEEPNALVELGEGQCREPNTRATVIEARDGLVASSQNRFPSLRFDLLSVNGLLHRFLVAGFYYKTFMWPASFWERVYERQIRRAAGLGRAADGADPDHYEHAHAHADVVVAGAGPAGLMAALAAGLSGARVLLIEAGPLLGGRLLWEQERVDDAPAADWIASVEARLRGMDNVRILTRTSLTSVYDHGVLSAVEHVPPLAETAEHLPRQRLWVIRSRQLVSATGALERPLVFDDNDRPGVMLATAVRRYLNQFAVAPGRRFLVATNNDDAYRTAFDLAAAGCEVAAIADARTEPGAVAEQARELGIRVLTGAVPARAIGGQSLRRVALQDPDGVPKASVDCDCLAVSGGFSPDVSLLSQCGDQPVWDAELAAFRPAGGVESASAAGSAAGAYALADCLAGGYNAGRDAAHKLGFTVAESGALPRVAVRPEAPIRPIWRCPGSGKAFVDLQNDVTVDDIRLADQEGFHSVEHLKRYTTLGMGTDQGKTSSVNGLGVLAQIQQRAIAEVGTTRFRPPAVPVAVGAYAGHRRGQEFAPVRRTAMDDWHRQQGALFIEAGHWLRPSCYPRDGEDIAAATWREALAVRHSVGICDVSTLGKIDVMGPDAAEFLNRIYLNGFLKLPVGKVRYGVMLRPDGHLFDDGTTSRFADDHFVTTTTTANAGRVLAHMEFHAQVAWPDLDVNVASATEQWATMAVAGPRSRETLQRALPEADLSNEALPFMGFLNLLDGPYPVRIFRISFSGELAYEVSVPWGYGSAMWRRIMAAGADFGISPYGTEALGVLRIEKGHPAGPEFDGRTTAEDIGLAGMVEKQKKDYVGKVLAARPGLADTCRPRLVGLRPLEPGGRLRGGAHLLEPGGDATIENSLGWLSSVTHSPHLEQWIALAFLRDGDQRHGQRLDAVFPLKGESVPVEVCSPCFIDPQGSRLRG